MKHLFLLLFCFYLVLPAFGQGSVGIGTDNPNPNAILDLKPSGAQGLQMPRLSTSDTISFTGSADQGMVFYDTLTGTIRVFDGVQWKELGSGGGGGAATVSFTARVDSLGNIIDQAGNNFTVSHNSTGSYTVTIGTPYAGIAGLTIQSKGIQLPSSVTYCTPLHASGCDLGDYIENVTFNTISNLSGCDGPGDPYQDFTSISTNVTAGNSYTISVDTKDEDGVIAYIDFNQDGTFQSTEEVWSSSSFTPKNNTWTGTVTIPVSAYNGSTVMRLRSGYLCVPGNTVPCASNSCLEFGETEDYTINISGGVTPPGGVVTTPVQSSYSALAGSGFNIFLYDDTGVPVDAEFTFMGQGY